MKKDECIILLSGGLDSAIAGSYLKNKGHSIKAGVFVNRGQSNYERELVAVRNVAKYLDIHLLYANFSIPDLGELLSSEMRTKLGIPARNLILGAMALPYVVALNCESLVLGNIASDKLPDCNEEFRLKFAAIASQVLEKKIEVVAPLADQEHWDKAGEISFAQRIGNADLFGLTWTCWSGGEFHCGICSACRKRKEGFISAGVSDPTVYEK